MLGVMDKEGGIGLARRPPHTRAREPRARLSGRIWYYYDYLIPAQALIGHRLHGG